MDGLNEQEEMAWRKVESELRLDLIFAADHSHQDVMNQFIADGGEPWDIYRTETAFLGTHLENLARTSDWQTY